MVTTQVWEETEFQCSLTDITVGFKLLEYDETSSFSSDNLTKTRTSSTENQSSQVWHCTLAYAHKIMCSFSSSEAPVQLHPLLKHLTNNFPSNFRTKRSGKNCGKNTALYTCIQTIYTRSASVWRRKFLLVVLRRRSMAPGSQVEGRVE